MSENGDIKTNTVFKKDKERGAKNKEQAIESESELDFEKKRYIKALKEKRKEVTRVYNCILADYYSVFNIDLECILGNIKRAYKAILLKIYLDYNKDLLDAGKVFNY